MACKDMLQTPQKIFIALCGVVILVVGSIVVVMGLKASSSDGFSQLSAMMSEASNRSFDSGSAILVFVLLGVLVIILGLSACWGALRESQCFLCGYVCFAMVMGPLLLCLSAAMAAYWTSEWPTVVKFTNRICGPDAPAVLEAQLNCTSTYWSGAGAMATRRLEEAVPADLGPVSRAWIMFHIAMEASSPDAGRRLFPGTAEESLLVRTCARLGTELCSSECALVDLICQTPPGYDPLKACVCDRSGPRNMGQLGIVPAICDADFAEPEMCQADSSGRRLGVFCMPQTSANVGDEACFILPTADCADKGWEVKPADKQPSYSSGPCNVPDARSKLALDGYVVGKTFVGFTAILGCTVLFSALCSFCLFVELYSGKAVSEHARGLMTDERDNEDAMSRDDDDGEWRRLTHVE